MSLDVLRGHLRRRHTAADAASVILPWAEVEPVEGDVRLPLSRLGATSRIRLTITAGTDCPPWLVDRCGPVPVVHGVRLAGHAARWWVPEYVAAWAALHERVATIIDGDDRVVELTLGAPHAGTGDPFARWASLGINRYSYILAGYHHLDDHAATADTIAAQSDAYAHTTQVLWLAPHVTITPQHLEQHLTPSLQIASQQPTTTLLGPARRLAPGPHLVPHIASLGRTAGPTSGTADWDDTFAQAGATVTSTEY